MIRLSVSFSKPYTAFGQDELTSVIQAADTKLKTATKDPVQINVRVTSAAEVRRLNRRYGGRDESTDVLSFNYAEGVSSPLHDKQGDIVINYEQIQAQAKAAKTSAATELALLALHGLLHILGYDHQSAAETAKMDKLQGKIMSAAGLAYRQFGWNQH